ncbi:hypothetical protein WR25_14380 [Diploscapter pachys]|uniref:7TM GPCR serpentine receptor class x (Srx) domain-containing protein n=1 Tax=Diploscapter pachys TaxID=2018661 RepID=A0A2A2LHX0_9BILA|nr:hypothetical protein WR25_14380 [Diploscapter pachys]
MINRACLQAGVFVLELITYFLLEPMFQSYFVKFCMTTVAWNLVHSTDGFITIFFNKEFRTVVSCLKKPTSISSSGNRDQKDIGITPTTD